MGRSRKGIRLSTMWWMGSALVRSGKETLRDFDDLMRMDLEQSVPWSAYLNGKREPNTEKIAAVERRVPTSAACLSSPLWKIHKGQWLDDDELEAAIAQLGYPIAATVIRVSDDDWSHAELFEAASAHLESSISFEGLEALALLANLARNRNSLELASKVQELYLRLLPQFRQLPEVGRKAGRFFQHFGTIFEEAYKAVRRADIGPTTANRAVAIDQAERAQAIQPPVQDSMLDDVNAQTFLHGVRNWPLQRILAGAMGCGLIAVLDVHSAQITLSLLGIGSTLVSLVIAAMLIAVAIDPRLADYRPARTR